MEKPSDGIQLIQNPSDPFAICADITGPVQTPYDGGVFKCTLKIDEEFPQKPPHGYFLTKIFHPNVSPAGEICVNILKKDWDPNNWSLRNIFEVIRCLLIVPFPESSLNEEAGKLFMENYDEYAKTARVYCAVYAKKKLQSPISSSENNMVIAKSESPVKPINVNEKMEDTVLGAITLNPQSQTAQKSEVKTEKEKNHVKPSADKKKWMKRI